MKIPKQLKITKLFKKGATKLPADCHELQDEIEQLTQKLREKQNEFFQLQRNRYRHMAQPKSQDHKIVRAPNCTKIILQNSVDSLKRDLELIAMLTNIEVQSYVANKYCCILFYIQHNSEHDVKHGIKIDLRNGVNNLSACSMPLGFNLEAVVEEYDNILMLECLGAIRMALFAYYDRNEQYHMLKKLASIHAELFKTLDASHVEIKFNIQNERDEDDEEQCNITLLLDYRVYDIRPKNYAIMDSDLTQDAVDLLSEQCAVFKVLPLHKAFQHAFVDGAGPFQLVQDAIIEEDRPRPRKRTHPRDPQNDDTFHPEDCSDTSDEEHQ